MQSEAENDKPIDLIATARCFAIYRNLKQQWHEGSRVSAAACMNLLADELTQLKADAEALAAEVRIRRAVPESSTAELLKAMEAVDASGALTRHTGDGT